MVTTAPRKRASFAVCEQDARRGGLTTLLLGLGVGWCALLAMIFWRDMGPVLGPLAASLAVLTGLTAWASWSTRPGWDRFGQYLAWYLFGLTLATWMIGIFSLGWLFLPLLMLYGFALLFWPRPPGVSIVTRPGMLFEIAGFLSLPAVYVLALAASYLLGLV